jgi:hypothetical protein
MDPHASNDIYQCECDGPAVGGTSIAVPQTGDENREHLPRVGKPSCSQVRTFDGSYACNSAPVLASVTVNFSW